MTLSRWLRSRPISRIEHADELAAARHRDAEQLLDRQREGVLLVHRRDVVEPVEIGDRLQVGLVLDQLLGAAVEQADMRIDALDDLAVELQHEAQHAVRRRMLRPEVDGEGADVGFSHGYCFAFSSPGSDVFGAFPRRQEIEVAEFLRELHRLVDDALAARRRSAPRRSRSAGSPCAADGPRSRSR